MAREGLPRSFASCSSKARLSRTWGHGDRAVTLSRVKPPPLLQRCPHGPSSPSDTGRGMSHSGGGPACGIPPLPAWRTGCPGALFCGAEDSPVMSCWGCLAHRKCQWGCPGHLIGLALSSGSPLRSAPAAKPHNLRAQTRCLQAAQDPDPGWALGTPAHGRGDSQECGSLLVTLTVAQQT